MKYNTKEEYIEALRSFDWWYEYTDDGQVWQRYSTLHHEIMNAAKVHDPDYAIYDSISPIRKARQ